jgi:hypothetical protein
VGGTVIDLVVLHEHPEWQKPLFAALEPRGVSFQPFDVTRAAFSNTEPLRARLYVNQARARRVICDINANSNLRPSVAAAFGFDPFERVVDFLVNELAR